MILPHPTPPSLVTPGGGGWTWPYRDLGEQEVCAVTESEEEAVLTVSPVEVVKDPQAWLLLFCLRSGREPRKPVEEYLGGGVHW